MRQRLAQFILINAGRLACWLDPEHTTMTVTEKTPGR